MKITNDAQTKKELIICILFAIIIVILIYGIIDVRSFNKFLNDQMILEHVNKTTYIDTTIKRE